MHKAGCGAHVWRRHTRQKRVCACARDTTTGRQKGLEGRVSVGGALAHPGYGMRDIVDARAGQCSFTQQGDVVVPVAATVFAGGGRRAHHGEEAAEQCGNRVARPGIRHAAPTTVDTLQTQRPWSELMVMGLNGQDGHNLARAQANAALDHPEEAVAQGGLEQGHAPQHASGVDADDRESSHPMDEGVRTRGFRDAEGPRQETQDARDGAKANASHSKEWQSQQAQVPLRQGDQALHVGLTLTQTRLGLCEGVSGSVSLGGDASDLCALGAIAITSLRGCVFPLMSTVVDCGELTHDAHALLHPDDHRPWGWGRLGLRCTCSHRRERSAARCPSQGSARDDGVTPTTSQGAPMTSNRLDAKPMAGEPGRFCGDASAP
jgi:hypothetical protein